MHEVSIIQALLDQVQTLVPAATRLESVHVEVGELEHLDPEVMTLAWAGATDSGPFAGARLEVVRVPLRVRCRACGAEHEPEDPAILLCPACGVVRPEVLEGSGVLLRRLEVEERS